MTESGQAVERSRGRAHSNDRNVVTAAPHADPFTDDTRSDLFYPDASRLRCLNLIRDHLRRGGAPLLVTGRDGVGKTALLDYLWSGTGPDWQVIALPSAAPAGELLEQLAAALGAAADADAASLDERLKEALESQTASDRVVVMVVDDADRLSGPALEALLAVTQAVPGSNLRLLLAGSAELPQRPPLVAFTPQPEEVSVPPLDEAGVAGYLDHRVRAAGMPADWLTPERCRTLWRASHGNPRVLNRLGRQALAAQEIPAPRKRLAGFPQRRQPMLAGAVLGAVLAVGAAAWLVIGGTESEPEVTELALVEPSEPGEAPRSAVHPEPEAVDGEAAPEVPRVMALILERPRGHETRPADTGIPMNEDGDRDAAWLLAQDETAYTIQLIGVHREATLDAFLASHPLDQDRIARFQVDYQDRPWHVLVFGLYADRDSADRAVSELPEALRERGVWVRPLASIQRDIETGRVSGS